VFIFLASVRRQSVPPSTRISAVNTNGPRLL